MLLLLSVLSGGAGGGAEPAPNADPPAVLRRVAERARTIATATNIPAASFRKLSISEFLDTDGEVRRATEKVYEVTLRRGMPQNRLVAVDGHELGAEESAQRSAGERRWREAYAGGGNSSPLDRMDRLVNDRLFARFEFSIAGRETVRGHSCVIIAFEPRPGPLPEERLIDRVINLLHGRIWVAENEDEIARIEAHTEGTLNLWGGILGRLEEFRLRLERDRGAPGIWFNRRTEAVVRARKLFSTVNFRLREVGGDPRTLPAPVEDTGKVAPPVTGR